MSLVAISSITDLPISRAVTPSRSITIGCKPPPYQYCVVELPAPSNSALTVRFALRPLAS
jgi:hypothetical protein